MAINDKNYTYKGIPVPNSYIRLSELHKVRAKSAEESDRWNIIMQVYADEQTRNETPETIIESVNLSNIDESLQDAVDVKLDELFTLIYESFKVGKPNLEDV